MRGTGRPVIVPKEVLDAPLRVPNAFKNQIKSIVTGNTNGGRGSTSSEGNRPVVPVENVRSKSEINGSDTNRKKFESGLLKLDILFSGPMEDVVIYRILDVLVFKDACTNEDLEAIASHAIDMTLTDSSNIIPICKYIFLFSLLPEKGQALRSYFFTCLQKVFEEKRHSLKGTPKYVNFARFLMASVHYNRSPLVAVADIFIASCLTVLQEMRDMIQEDEIKARAELFIRCGQYTRKSSPDLKRKFFETKDDIRHTLSKETSLTPRARLWLMLALECSNGVVSPDTVEYYSEKLGAEQVTTLEKTDFKIVIPKIDAKRFVNSAMKIDDFVIHV